MDDLRRRHNLTLTDEAWAALLQHAGIERTTASDLCEFLLRSYVDLGEKQIYTIPYEGEGAVKRKRSVFLTDGLWSEVVALRVFQMRSISEILEQLIRGYTGLSLGERVINTE